MPIPSSLGEYKSQVVKQVTTAGANLKAAVAGVGSLKDTFSINNIKNQLFGKTTNTSEQVDQPDPNASSGPNTKSSGSPKSFKDLRVRISLPPAQEVEKKLFYRDERNSLMKPLAKTAGFIFPIQPQIAMGFEAAYQESALTHTNFPYYHYQNSKITPIQLTGDFPIRTTFDANYVMAGIHFLRSSTRMFNGQDLEYAGAPPIVLRLNGLGFSGFDNIPVVLTSVSVNYSDSVDFISFYPLGETTETARVPTSVQITVAMNPIFSRDFITNSYSTLKYSSGKVRLLGINEPPAKPKIPTIDPPPELPNVAPIPSIGTGIGLPLPTLSGALPGPPPSIVPPGVKVP
jgi:hypothetical protein